EDEIDYCNIEGSFEETRFFEILFVLLRCDERLCSNLVSSSFQSFQVAIRVSMMIPELRGSRQRNARTFQVIPKGLRIANSAKRKERTAADFAEIAWGLPLTCQPESQETCLRVKNRQFARILGFYVRPLCVTRDDENVCPATC